MNNKKKKQGIDIVDAVSGIADAFVGNTKNAFQDIRAGAIAGNPKIQKSNDEATKQAEILEQQATAAKDKGDWENASLLFKRAKDLRMMVGEQADLTRKQFSPDVNKNPLERATKAGLEMGAVLAPVANYGGSGIDITKAVLQNAAGGAAFAAANDENPIVGGAAGAAVPAVIQGVGKVIKAGTGKVAEEIANRAFKEPTKKLTKAAISKGDELGGKVLKEGGIKGVTDEGIYKSAIENMDKLENQLQDKLKGSDKVIKIDDLSESLLPRISQLEDAGEVTAANTLKTRLSLWESRFKNGIPVQKANEIKRTLYDRVNKSYGDKAAQGTEDMKLAAKVLKESIRDSVEGVDAINKKLSYYGRIKDSMLNKMASGGGLGGMAVDMGSVAAAPYTGGASLAIPVINRVVNTPGVQKTGAQMLDKTGKVIEAVTDSFPVQKTAQMSASLLPKNDLQESNPNYTDQPPADKTHSIEDYTIQPQKDQMQQKEKMYKVEDTQTGQIIEVPESKLTEYNLTAPSQPAQQEDKNFVKNEKDRIYKAIQWDIQNNQGKMVSELNSQLQALKAVYPDEENGTGTGLAAKDKGTVNAGLTNLKDVRQMLEEDPSLLAKQLIPGQFLSRKLDSALYDMADTLLRLRTGAQANPNEIRGYMNKIAPSFGDDPETIEYKLNKLESDLKSYLGSGDEGVSVDNAVQNESDVKKNSNSDPISLIKKYFPQDQWNNAYTIMMAESGGQNIPSQYNQYGGEDSHGLFQINLMAHPQMANKVYDPEENIKYAAQLYSEQGWSPWLNSAKKLGLV